jgi:hypothetical protein
VLYDQLHTKDDQTEKLNENMHKQAVHIQTLIPENSRLNIKLLRRMQKLINPSGNYGNVWKAFQG